MSTLLTEKRLTLADAARRENVDPSTIWRWIFKGVLQPGAAERLRLESLIANGRRCTTVQALRRFRAAAVAVDPDPQPRKLSEAELTARRRRAKLTAARRTARQAGI